MLKRMMLNTSALALAMAGDTAALQAKFAAEGAPFTKDGEPSLADIKKAQDAFTDIFEQFKAKNDERLEQIEKKGDVDPVTKEELAKIQSELIDLKSVRDDLDKLAKKLSRPGGGAEGETLTPEQKEHQDAFLTFMRSPEDESAKATLQELQKKAVDTTTDAGGGYAVPEVIARVIQRNLLEIQPLRDIVHVVQAGSKDYKELVDLLGLNYGWVGETQVRSETGTPTVGEVAPTFGMLYAYPKASEEALVDMFFDVQGWLVQSIAEGFAAGEENAIVNGDGANKPTGFLNGTPVDTDDGARAFGALQYVPSGAAGALVASTDADPFITLIQKLKRGYRNNARFLMNKMTVGEVMKLKDGDGNYLWKMGDIQNGQPDRLMGYAITESEEMPDIAADAFPIAFGDFNAGYLLADLVGFRLTRDEITQPGYVKWYARRRLGGQVRKSEAIKLLKLSAS